MALPQFGWTAGNGITPSYLWSRDEIWFLATSIDLDSRILAGPSRLVAKVKAFTGFGEYPRPYFHPPHLVISASGLTKGRSAATVLRQPLYQFDVRTVSEPDDQNDKD